MKEKTGILLILLFLILSCNSGKKDRNQEEELITGKVTDNLEALVDPTMDYAYYIPTRDKHDSLLPVIFAFDPKGAGSFPIALYKDLADKYGYILIGSNNSRNGMDGNELAGVIHSTITDVKNRFPVDTGRMYTMGFSGGARVAVMSAMLNGNIISVTGSGAGFPTASANPNNNFAYVGMAGTSDFNMHELILLDEFLDKSGSGHALLLFDGIHDWPPKDVMERSFLWNDLLAMKEKKKPLSQQETDHFKKIQDSLIVIKKDQKDLIGLHRELKNAIAFLDKIEETGNYSGQLKDLENSQNYKAAVTRLKKQQEEELSAQNDLQKDFFAKDSVWWGKKLNSWQKLLDSGKETEEVLMTRRLKSYLGLLCYMNYSGASKAGEADAMAHAMWIYEKVDPEHAAQTKNGK